MPLTELTAQLNHLSDQNADILSQLARLAERLDGLSNRYAKLDTIICGNGKPGLVVDVDRLQRAADRRSWFSKTALVAAITSLAAVIGDIIHHFLK